MSKYIELFWKRVVFEVIYLNISKLGYIIFLLIHAGFSQPYTNLITSIETFKV